MNKCQHPSNNFVLRAPDGMTHEQCSALPVTYVQYEDGTKSIRSYWKPTAEELEILSAGGYVCVEVLGITMPPVILTAESV